MEIVDEADAVADMRELARMQWKRRAQKMGLAVAEPEGESGSQASPPSTPA